MKLPMKLFSACLNAVLLVCAASVAQAEAAGVRVTLTSDTAQIAGSEDVNVNVKLTNVSSAAVLIPKKYLPTARSAANFTVIRDGQPVRYLGLLVKRGALTAADYVKLGSGESVDYSVELSSLYDLSSAGVYTVRYDARSMQVPASGRSASTARPGADPAATQGDVQFEDAASNALALTVTSSAFPELNRSASDLTTDASRDLAQPQFAASVSFIGCSNSRISSIRTALSSSESYAGNASSYLNAGTRGARYTTWFGTYKASRYSTVTSHFTKIKDALTNKPMQFDCSTCPKDPELADAYAYVYPDQHYRIYLCNTFWRAPNTGTDSRAGTIIHEASHFNVLGGTDDNAYGQSAAKALARSNPARAVDNADSHEYFAENTPAQN